MKMLTGRGGTKKRKQQKHSSVISEKWRRYHLCDKAKIIPQNLHAIYNRKEDCLFSPDGVIVPSSKMIFSPRFFWTVFRLVCIKEQKFPCH